MKFLFDVSSRVKSVKSFLAEWSSFDASRYTVSGDTAFDALVRENAKLAHDRQRLLEMIENFLEVSRKSSVVFEDIADIATLSAESLREMIDVVRKEKS